MYMGGVVLFTISFTYASVPLYRIFCQKTGFGGTVKAREDVMYEQKARPVSGKRMIQIKFNSDVSESLPWSFTPQHQSVNVVPGEACLAFYTAHNKTNKAIVGVSTYNVQPFQAALYFNKIQCFCFEEQMLHANEKIDMPVFFFIDPEIMNDRSLDNIDTIILSYTFFKVGDADAPDVAGLLVPAHPPRAGAGTAAHATA
eukprot:CAMPEP_0173410028 /NCGR_PEP_ID=MMETSP1356-20130122/73605_1 /TAXON_ID=77927 ORGANISM="Hemiselmis virescens, Strain PCC157" /NCGR_SAMPLE_ID=MMETSP1356 /ASSEMBLY_ACC=CAM_ASM_000847 /LENGTH=199 /DNA_ID=CAMNT_0014371599 /DNA_START=1 /DNA_END=600 /DNA_ORIENTATION=+